MTDELTGMKAVSRRYTASSAAITALAAGADMVLLSQPGPIDQLIARMAAAVSSGALPASRVANAAAHVLMVKKCQ